MSAYVRAVTFPWVVVLAVLLGAAMTPKGLTVGLSVAVLGGALLTWVTPERAR